MLFLFIVGECLKCMRGNWMWTGFGYRRAVLLVPRFPGVTSLRGGRSSQVSIYFSMLRVSLISGPLGFGVHAWVFLDKVFGMRSVPRVLVRWLRWALPHAHSAVAQGSSAVASWDQHHQNQRQVLL